MIVCIPKIKIKTKLFHLHFEPPPNMNFNLITNKINIIVLVAGKRKKKCCEPFKSSKR